MRTNVMSTVTVVVHLDEGERFDYRMQDDDVLVIEEVGYSGGRTSVVGRRTLKTGRLAKRTTVVWNADVLRVPDEIRASVRGAVRAHIGEQARALGLLP